MRNMAAMENSEQVVRDFYDRIAEREWERHDRHRLEFPTTMHFIHKYIPCNATVLDVGGGPGRYAQQLAMEGHTVDLVDLSPRSIELARTLASKRGTPIRRFCVANAANLESFETATYDVVLNLGPLYHLIEERDRRRAISESLRVLRPGGLLAAGFISSFGRIYDVLYKDPRLLNPNDELATSCRISQVYLESQRYFTDGYVIEPFEVERLMMAFPAKKLAVIGAEGLFAQSERAICQCGEEVIRNWVDLCKSIADTPEAVGASIHVTYFGRKL